MADCLGAHTDQIGKQARPLLQIEGDVNQHMRRYVSNTVPTPSEAADSTKLARDLNDSCKRGPVF